MLDLNDELELFTLVANDTKSLLLRVGAADVLLDRPKFTRILSRCDAIVTEIGQSLEQYARTTGNKKTNGGQG